MATATWVREELDRRGIAYQELQHPDAFTAAEVAQKEHVSGHRVAKVVCAMADGRPVELILPASRRVNLDRVRELLNVREIRLASEKELAQLFTDCELGAVPAMRHWEGVDVMMDGQLCCGGDIYILGGTHRDAIRMQFDDWFAMVSPRVESFTDPS
ncbi:MAG TPA: YbaK/EbsC family protein [Gemmataceae bacterium]|nr:YbaK/EbsC family protein [Gemmataceae bacterium]